MTEDEYIKIRVDDQINWYSNKARTNKNLNNWVKALVILFSSSIPWVAALNMNVEIKNILLGGFGAFIAILSGLSGVLKFHDKWTKYRFSAEMLIQEKMLFQTKSGSYESAKESFKLLVANIEDILNSEHSGWNKYIHKEN